MGKKDNYWVNYEMMLKADIFGDVNCIVQGHTLLCESFKSLAYKLDSPKLLIKYGADVNKPCINGEVPLYVALKRGNRAIFKLLLGKFNLF